MTRLSLSCFPDCHSVEGPDKVFHHRKPGDGSYRSQQYCHKESRLDTGIM